MVKTVSNSKKVKKVVAIEESQPAQEEELKSVVSSSSEGEMGSDEDEIEGLSDLENDDDDNDAGEGKGHKIKKLSNKKKNQTDSKKNKKDDGYSSILYVSRLPHGFHERELSKYFSQFGDLKEVRLARNKKSGNSRHYGFIEFANKDDAKIAQETMNNYLLMGHLLQVRLMGKGSKIEKLYKYKKRSFNESKIKKNKKELKDNAKLKHDERMDKLTKAGIEFKW